MWSSVSCNRSGVDAVRGKPSRQLDRLGILNIDAFHGPFDELRHRAMPISTSQENVDTRNPLWWPENQGLVHHPDILHCLFSQPSIDELSFRPRALMVCVQNVLRRCHTLHGD